MTKSITDMTQEEIRAEIDNLRRIQPPRVERKPQRVGEPKQPKPGRKPSWRDQLGF